MKHLTVLLMVVFAAACSIPNKVEQLTIKEIERHPSYTVRFNNSEQNGIYSSTVVHNVNYGLVTLEVSIYKNTYMLPNGEIVNKSDTFTIYSSNNKQHLLKHIDNVIKYGDSFNFQKYKGTEHYTLGYEGLPIKVYE